MKTLYKIVFRGWSTGLACCSDYILGLISGLCLLMIYSCSPDGTKKVDHMGDVEQNLSKQDLMLRLDKAVAPYIDSGFVGVVLVADSSDVILNKAYGKNGSKLNPNTAFWIASNTKPVTAIAILKLAEEGRLSVKDSITKYFKNVTADKKSITIEQLLTHTSGLPSDFVCEGEQNSELAMKKILSQKLIAQPGKEFNYTNDGYILLAAIIEKSSGIKYESYVRSTIFIKAGMIHSNFWGDDAAVVDPVNDSAQYQLFYSKIFKNGKPLENWNNKGAAGISSTTGDLYKMLVSLKEGRLLDKNSLKELFMPRVEVDHMNDATLSYGYGWAIVHSKSQVVEIRHRGRGDWMHNNSIFLLPNDLIVMAWSKDSGPNTTNWSTEVCNSIIKDIMSVKEE